MHILVVEHNPERARALVATLSSAGHRPEVVGSASAGLAALARPAPPDLVLVEERMPDMPALDFLQAAGGIAPPPPVIVLGDDEAAARWVEATRLGAVDLVAADASGEYLRTLAARLQAAHERSQARDAVARMADALASTSAAVVLTTRGGQVERVNEACAHLLGRPGADLMGQYLADLFPLADEPRLKADLLAAVHQGGEWAGEIGVLAHDGQRVPCIVTVSPIRRANERLDGVVLTLRDVSDRVAMEDALRAANRRLAEQASRDSLTGIYNRGYFHEVLEREMARAVRYGDVLAVLMIDLDEFKRINDEHGHAEGDVVLCEVARLVRPVLRDGDVFARYGGDEFCVLLPNTSAQAAHAVAERLRAAVAERRYGPDEGSALSVSIGVATSIQVGEVKEDAGDAVLRLADRAQYRSKRTGGNRVTVWSADIDAA